MSNYKIITDSCCDLPKALCQELEVDIAPLGVDYDGKFFEDGQMPIKEFYDGIRAGKTSTTSAVNPKRWTQVMEPILAGGQDVLALCFSSGLSTTYQSAVIAAEELGEKYPDRKIQAVDTLAASAGQGLLVWYAAKQRQAGKPMEEVRQWVLDHMIHVAHWVTVDDLKYLKRGGRISATTAVVGTMLNIKPIIHLDNDGKLLSVAKARGRKAALNYVAEKLGQTGLPGANEVIAISHADCEEDARYIADIVKAKYGVKEVILCDIGSVIGSHTGPGGLACCFLAKER